MTEADVIQPSASIASTGKGIRYIGNRAYSFSGELALSTSLQDFLNFTTGSGYIVADINFTGDYDALGADWVAFNIKLNGTNVFLSKMERNNSEWMNYAKILLPPFTEVQIEGKVQDGTPTFTCVLVGRVYGAT